MRPALLFLACILGFCFSLRAQDPNATVSGRVLDSSGAVAPGSRVTVINDATNIGYSTETNEAGIYSIQFIPPGKYHIQVSKNGFKNMVKPDVILHVQDALTINFTLELGAGSESVTVEGGAPLINTESAAVSTVVDRQFVENMPLNGRSFQTLIALTPGVVLTQATGVEPGQFSVNGQRADANYFTVDGVSANVGAANVVGQAVGGAVPAFSAQGGTNNLVSVDAMQEFRIQTSSFAPEFGRSPGGQVSIVTRSGSNDFHGLLFEYFRNDALDANNWFSNRDGLGKPQERQNDFGGTFAGPILKDKTFFFLSYEGLRLRQPFSQETVVPDTASREAAPTAIQPFLNAFSAPNGSALGGGLAQFNASYSNPSSLNAYSIRMDHAISPKVALFGRYNYAPSESSSRLPTSLSSTSVFHVNTQTVTLGLTFNSSAHLNNEFRTNYSNVKSRSASQLDSFGGATPPPDAILFPAGFSSKDSNFGFVIGFLAGAPQWSLGRGAAVEQRQLNFVDNVSISVRAHQTRFGVDYRWLAPFYAPFAYSQSAKFSSMDAVLSGTVDSATVEAFAGSALLSRNVSVYAQDTWKIKRLLTITYGLRWDVNPAPKGKNSANDPFTVEGLTTPATMTLAPRGTPLYDTTYGNLAPRVGGAFQLNQAPGRETVLRSGFGVFYDLGTGSLGDVVSGFPYAVLKFPFGVPFPLTAQDAAPPPFSVTPSPANRANLNIAVPNLKLPRTYQWNVALEQALGLRQTLTITYIGAAGRDLLRNYTLLPAVLGNPNFGSVTVTGNDGTSDYESVQFQFQRRISHGIQALASYNLAHSIDNASRDSGSFVSPGVAGNLSLERGNSDFDARHTFSGALTYDISVPGWPKTIRSILGDWSLDGATFARSALPVDIVGGGSLAAGTFFSARPNVNVGVPLYLFGPQHAGGKAFNSAAFSAAPFGKQGDFGRNVLRGFGMWQADLALRRQFHLTERVGLQFRAELFNIFNHPNFGNPSVLAIFQPLFGQSTQTLAQSLGTGGLAGGFNPLYQVGGPRSTQFALRLQF